MSVHKKLMDARIRLQDTNLKKSGVNKFSNYSYFELGDFIPQVQKIFNDIGLCGVISYGSMNATLTITDIETNTTIEVMSPMSEANLKGCHAVQNLGAVETYIRRYLWVTAMEIVEHDALDATTGSDKKGIHKPTDQEGFQPDAEELKFLQGVLDTVNSKATPEAAAVYLNEQNLDTDEKIWVWDKLDSKTRSGIKKFNSEKKEG